MSTLCCCTSESQCLYVNIFKKAWQSGPFHDFVTRLGPEMT